MTLSFNSQDFEFIRNTVIRAGEIGNDIRKHGVSVVRKQDSSIVTQADIEIQRFLIEAINGRFPGISFIHEEDRESSFQNATASTALAIIDPVDGTAVYSMGLPTWSISIGFFNGFTPVYGFVYSPGCDMFFYNDDRYTYLNGERLHVDPEMIIDNETNIFVTAEIFRIYGINFPGKIRNLGSTALHACLVAGNRSNRTLAFIGKSYLWDWAGAIPVLQKAGATVRYFSGEELDYAEIMKNSFRLREYCIACSLNDFAGVRRVFTPL